MIDNKEIQKILEKQGDVRGAVFQTDANYILKLGSPDDLLKVDNQFSFVDVTLIKKTEMDLQEKVADLERFQKIAIGRELKMVELKEEIKKLQE